MSYRNIIVDLFHEVLESTGSELQADLVDDLVLLNSGLDSLGFAILVARLEEETGFDPFVEMQEAVYPNTFGQFVKIYDQRDKQT